ncbi:MAG: hypothetical protein ACRC33_14145 [Gemmataceae bacterium]
MPPARKPAAPVYPIKASGLNAVAAGVSGSPPPTLGALIEVAAAFEGLFRHHPHFRRFQARPPLKKPRKPRAGSATPKRPPRVKAVAPSAFLATRIDLSAAPPVTVSGANFIAELWPRGVLDVYSNEPVAELAALNAHAAAAVRHTFEVTAIAAGVVTLSVAAPGEMSVEADVFASRLPTNCHDLTAVERVFGSLLIKGRIGWSGECRQVGFAPPRSDNGTRWPALTWTWRELIDLTPAVRAAPLLVLLATPAG